VVHSFVVALKDPVINRAEEAKYRAVHQGCHKRGAKKNIKKRRMLVGEFLEQKFLRCFLNVDR
jgi:hypothetical protein